MTTMVVVKDQEMKRLAGHQKNSERRKAEGLIPQGAAMKILRESDFKELVKVSEKVG